MIYDDWSNSRDSAAGPADLATAGPMLWLRWCHWPFGCRQETQISSTQIHACTKSWFEHKRELQRQADFLSAVATHSWLVLLEIGSRLNPKQNSEGLVFATPSHRTWVQQKPMLFCFYWPDSKQYSQNWQSVLCTLCMCWQYMHVVLIKTSGYWRYIIVIGVHTSFLTITWDKIESCKLIYDWRQSEVTARSALKMDN